MRRLVGYGVLVTVLTLGGAGWALWRSALRPADLAPLLRFSPGSTTAIALACVGIYFTDVVRYRVLGWAVNARVAWGVALDASVANFFFSWVTPGTAFGAPAAIYMLGRGGVSLEAAALIAVGKSLLGIAVLLLLALACMVLGWAPHFGAATVWLILPGTALVTGLLLTLVLASLYDTAATRTVRRAFRLDAQPAPLARRAWTARVGHGVVGAIGQLARLRARGPATFVAIFASHVVYFASFLAVAVLVAAELDATPLVQNVGASTVYLAFSYVAPTPGGAGLAEAVAVPFFGHVLPIDAAVLAVLLFRGLTFYLQVMVGLVYLIALGALSKIVRAATAARPGGAEAGAD